MSIAVRDVIVKKTEHIFKDDNTRDIKQSRDCLIMIVNVNSQSYYLILSSHQNNAFEWYQRFPEQNYLLSKKKCEGLEYTSCVNLEDIYEGEPLGKLVVVVPDSEYRKLIAKFKRWQEDNPDELYSSIKEYL